MNDNYTIEQFCSINEHSISINGETIYKDNLAKTLQEFLKSAYKTLNINYPKFFKMDTLSKLAFLTADVILNSQINSETDIALVFQMKIVFIQVPQHLYIHCPTFVWVRLVLSTNYTLRIVFLSLTRSMQIIY